MGKDLFHREFIYTESGDGGLDFLQKGEARLYAEPGPGWQLQELATVHTAEGSLALWGSVWPAKPSATDRTEF